MTIGRGVGSLLLATSLLIDRLGTVVHSRFGELPRSRASKDVYPASTLLPQIYVADAFHISKLNVASWISAYVTRSRALGLFLTSALLASAPACEAAQKVLRIGYIMPKVSPIGAGADMFAAEIARRTAGRYAVEAYPNSMLGTEAAMIQDLRVGALDLAFIGCAELGSLVPSAGVFTIPFLFRDTEQARRTLDGPIGSEYLAKFDETGLAALAWGEMGVRHLTSSSRDLSTPKGLNGIKLRVPSLDAMNAGFKSLGARLEDIPFNQLYNALKDRRVEAQENTIAIMAAAGFAQVQTHLYLTAHVYDPAAFLMSRDLYDALSEEDRRTFREVGRLAGLASRQFDDEHDRSGLKILRDQGMSIVSVDRDAFAREIAVAAPTWNAWYGAAEIARVRSYNLDGQSTASVAARP